MLRTELVINLFTRYSYFFMQSPYLFVFHLRISLIPRTLCLSYIYLYSSLLSLHISFLEVAFSQILLFPYNLALEHIRLAPVIGLKSLGHNNTIRYSTTSDNATSFLWDFVWMDTVLEALQFCSGIAEQLSFYFYFLPINWKYLYLHMVLICFPKAPNVAKHFYSPKFWHPYVFPSFLPACFCGLLLFHIIAYVCTYLYAHIYTYYHHFL